jgi:hypothetical protein
MYEEIQYDEPHISSISVKVVFYMVEVFTKPGTNSEWCRRHIVETTGFVPAIYDKGTRYVTNMRLTLDILKRLDEFEFVEEITGDYTGTLTGLGASHENVSLHSFCVSHLSTYKFTSFHHR